jgi:hypothetical protein
MGGSGSGTYYRYSSKSTEENFHAFRMSRLCELGVVCEGNHRHGGWQWTRGDEVISSLSYEVNMLDVDYSWLRVRYTTLRTQEKHDYKIHLISTEPNYGGRRWWFRCPGGHCGRRVGVLYLGNVLVCRHCWGMGYSSQGKNYYDRQSDRAFKLAHKLGHDGNALDGFYGPKPKGMHWRTYRRKIEAIEHATESGLAGMMVRFGRWV